MNKTIILIISFLQLAFLTQINAQAGIGIVTGFDLYQQYTNPTTQGGASSGSAILNPFVGPKVWLGTKEASLSLEAQVNWAMVGLSLNEYKGLGHIAFPIIANLNFGKLSGLTRKNGFGFLVGAGLQYSKTELYGLNPEFDHLERSLFPTMIVQAGIGYGISGFGGSLVGRYGFDNDSNARTFNIAIQVDMNFVKMKEIDDPASRL